MGEEKKSDYEDAYAPRERAAKNEPLSASASSMYTSSIVRKPFVREPVTMQAPVKIPKPRASSTYSDWFGEIRKE